MPIRVATVRAADIPASQTNFTFYVDLGRVGATALTLAEAQSSRWYTDTDLVTEMAREIVSLTEGHGKYGTLTSTSKVAIDYDGIRADYAVSDTFGRNNVWTGYDVVWHLQGTTSSTGSYDITMTNATSGASGKLGDCYDFPKTADERGQTTTDAPTTLNTWTASAWVRMDNLINYSGVFHKVSTTRDGAGANQDIMLIVHNNGTIGSNDGGAWFFSTAASIVVSTWFHLSWVRSGTIIAYYVNAVARGTSTYANSNTAGFKFGVGAWYQPSRAFSPDGKIDSVKFKQTADSANWITTEYNNQNDEATFWGTWTTFGGGAAAVNARRLFLMMM